LLVSIVTEPARASARPLMSAPLLSVIEARAMMVPTKSVSVPRVAELPTCQNTLHGEAPLMRLTLLPDAVVSVEPIWNTHTALGSPWASRVRSPVSWAELLNR
jgi:hypothetical protein